MSVTFLKEAKHRGTPLVGKYSARVDTPHDGTGQRHIHVYDRSVELFAMNANGTAHDQYHQVRIPGRVAKAIQVEYPDFVIPPDRFIESIFW